MGESHVGLQARLMSQALRKLTGIIQKSNTSVVFINQLREKVGVVYGSPEVTSGGKALKFYASMRFDVRRSETIKQGSEIVGNKTKVKITKNKLASPFKIVDFDIYYGKGISSIGCILDLAVQNDLIDKAGSWFSYNNEKIGQGREKAIEFLNNNPDILEILDKKIREIYGLKQ